MFSLAPPLSLTLHCHRRRRCLDRWLSRPAVGISLSLPSSPLPGSKRWLRDDEWISYCQRNVVRSRRMQALRGPRRDGRSRKVCRNGLADLGFRARFVRRERGKQTHLLHCVPPPRMFQKCHDASTNSTTDGIWTGSYVETRPPDWYVRPPPCDSGEVGDGVTFGEWILENPDGVLQEVRRGRATERGRLGSNFWPATPSTALSRSSLKVRN